MAKKPVQSAAKVQTKKTVKRTAAPSKTIQSPKEPAHAQSVFSSESTSRKLKKEKKLVSNPKTWRKKYPARAPLPKARHIMKSAWDLLKTAPKPLAGIVLVYGVCMLLFVRGFSLGRDLLTLKATLDTVFTGAGEKAQGFILQLSFLFSDTNRASTSESGVYQVVLLVVCSLAFIWALRQLQAHKKITTRLAFYRGMYPLVPFLLVVCIIGLQILPFTFASMAFGTLVKGGVLVHAWEIILVTVVCALLTLWTVRMLTGSIFALYIVTLANMRPIEAVRASQELVGGRRLLVLRKIAYLPAYILVISSIIIAPFLLWLAPVAVWIFFAISAVWFGLIHSYMYSLYRELLG